MCFGNIYTTISITIRLNQQKLNYNSNKKLFSYSNPWSLIYTLNKLLMFLKALGFHSFCYQETFSRHSCTDLIKLWGYFYFNSLMTDINVSTANISAMNDMRWGINYILIEQLISYDGANCLLRSRLSTNDWKTKHFRFECELNKSITSEDFSWLSNINSM